MGWVALGLTAYAEAGRAFVGIDPGVYVEGVAGKRRMLRDRDWKLLYVPRPDGASVALFDLKRDGAEKRDVAAANPEIVGRLRERLDGAMAESSGSQEEQVLSEEEKDRLRALGYL